MVRKVKNTTTKIKQVKHHVSNLCLIRYAISRKNHQEWWSCFNTDLVARLLSSVGVLKYPISNVKAQVSLFSRDRSIYKLQLLTCSYFSVLIFDDCIANLWELWMMTMIMILNSYSSQTMKITSLVQCSLYHKTNSNSTLRNSLHCIDVANVQNVLYNFWKDCVLLRSYF